MLKHTKGTLQPEVQLLEPHNFLKAFLAFNSSSQSLLLLKGEKRMQKSKTKVTLWQHRHIGQGVLL